MKAFIDGYFWGDGLCEGRGMGHFGLATVWVFHKMHLEQSLLMRGINHVGALPALYLDYG